MRQGSAHSPKGAVAHSQPPQRSIEAKRLWSFPGCEARLKGGARRIVTLFALAKRLPRGSCALGGEFSKKTRTGSFPRNLHGPAHPTRFCVRKGRGVGPTEAHRYFGQRIENTPFFQRPPFASGGGPNAFGPLQPNWGNQGTPGRSVPIFRLLTRVISQGGAGQPNGQKILTHFCSRPAKKSATSDPSGFALGGGAIVLVSIGKGFHSQNTRTTSYPAGPAGGDG